MADPEHIRVRVARGSYRYDGEHFEPGDELEVREELLERHPQTLEQVSESESESSGSEAEAEAEAELADEDEEICGEVMSSGAVCERPAGDCPYHEQDQDQEQEDTES